MNRIERGSLWAMARAVYAVAYAIGWVGGMTAIASVVALLWRAVIFLKDGVWFGTLCNVTSAANLNEGIHLPDACAPVATSWRGIDMIAAWFQYQADASVSLGIVAAILLVVTILLVAMGASIDSDLPIDG